MDDLCEDLAEGKTLTEFTREHDLKYKIVFEWITGDDDRRDKYEVALKARGHHYQETVLSQIRTASKANLLDAIDEDGSVLPPGKIPEGVKAAISGYKVTVDGRSGNVTTELKLADKTRNAELLGKTQAMFTDRVDLGGKMTLEQLVNASLLEEPPDGQPQQS